MDQLRGTYHITQYGIYISSGEKYSFDFITFFDSSFNLNASSTFPHTAFFHSTPITILYSGFEWLAHPASRASSWAELDTFPYGGEGGNSRLTLQFLFMDS